MNWICELTRYTSYTHRLHTYTLTRKCYISTYTSTRIHNTSIPPYTRYTSIHPQATYLHTHTLHFYTSTCTHTHLYTHNTHPHTSHAIMNGHKTHCEGNRIFVPKPTTFSLISTIVHTGHQGNLLNHYIFL